MAASYSLGIDPLITTSSWGFLLNQLDLGCLKKSCDQLSHEKKPPTFYYTGCSIGILIMAYYNPPYNGGSIIRYTT